ncbi:MAG: PKD domain-containing protein [Owenweeksia sp.]
MQTFLQQFAHKLIEQGNALPQTAVIMPSRRAAVFLKKELSKLIDRPMFAPHITTIEDFLLENLEWQQEENANLIFKLYHNYQELPLEKKDSFSDFVKWAPTLLADFNELDRHLVQAKDLFGYLADVKRIEQWDLTPGETADTPMVREYLHFWENLPALYHNFTTQLREAKRVYQGLAYREMALRMADKIPEIQQRYSQLYFAGFSALNQAEESIFLQLYEADLAEFYWDIDRYYYKDEMHEAGKFLRQSKLLKRIKEDDRLHWLEDNLAQQPKKITVKAVSGNTLQMMTANASIVEYLDGNLEDIALVMADESLLQTFLNHLAEPIEKLNVTMGLPMKNASISGFFRIIWEMQTHYESKAVKDRNGNPAFYHQKWNDLLAHPLWARIHPEPEHIERWRTRIREQNKVFIAAAELEQWTEEQLPAEVKALFADYRQKPEQFCNAVARFCEWLKERLEDRSFNVHILFSFFKLFRQLANLFTAHDVATDLKTAHHFYRELLATETIDLRGEPLSGLQVMGMLETRTLDFRNLVLTSINEDILPKGRSQNSFIPFDIKTKFGLPTYLDKDAIFAYHFYRLLQRAENITLIYNSQNSGLGGGEPSRFIAQLEYELIRMNPNIQWERQTISGRVRLEREKEKVVEKSEAVMERLRQMASRGISPTALIDYVNNPLHFYYRRVLGIDDADEVEEVIGYNTQGSVLHEILEDYYSENEDRAQGPVQKLNTELPAFQRKEAELRKEVVKRLREMGLPELKQADCEVTDIMWDFGDGNTVTGNFNPQHTYSYNGVYNVCATIFYIDIAGKTCAKTYCGVVTIEDCEPAPCDGPGDPDKGKTYGDDPQEEVSSSLGLSVYPNPSSGLVYINFNTPSAGKVEVNVEGVTGKHIATLVDTEMESGNHTVNWDPSASGKAYGMYYIVVKYGEKGETVKFIYER